MSSAVLLKTMDEQRSIKEYIEKLIHDDNKTEFISCLRSDGRLACDFSPSQLLKLICMHRATGCATELLGDKSGFSVDVNVVLEDGFTPLQLAAKSLSSGLTSILLEHGALANVCDERGSRDLAMLPLHMAIHAISDLCVSDWSPQKSIYKLLYIFCLRDLKEPLETIRYLAERTEDIEKLGLYYVEEENVVGLAALLMVAWDRVVPPNVEDVEKTLVGQHIWRQVAHVSDKELQFLINCGPNCLVLERLKSKKINLLTEWKFLKVLEIARDAIEKYLNSYQYNKKGPNHEVPYDVAYHLCLYTGIVLRPDDVFSDDIDCLREKLTSKEKAHLNEAIEKQIQLWSMETECKKKDVGGPGTSHQNELFARSTVSSPPMRPNGSGCCSFLSPTSFSSSCSYHTWVDISINRGKPAESRVPRNIQKLVKPQLSVFSPSTKICARLLLCAKRIVK